jgi:hypothetical protein
MSERQGVEIDYCPQCRGVWLDRGELDKIIEKSQADPGPKAPPKDFYRDHDDDHRRHGGGYYKGRQKNWLSDLFD